MSSKTPGVKKPMDIFVKICFEATVGKESDLTFIAKITKIESLANAVINGGVPLTEESSHNLDLFFQICHNFADHYYK